MLELLLMMPGEPGGTPDHAQILCSYWTIQDNGASSLARTEVRAEAGAGSSMDTTCAGSRVTVEYRDIPYCYPLQLVSDIRTQETASKGRSLAKLQEKNNSQCI